MSAYCSKQHEGLWVFAVLIKRPFWTRLILRKKVKGAGVSVASIMYIITQPQYNISINSQSQQPVRRFSGSYWWRMRGPSHDPVCIWASRWAMWRPPRTWPECWRPTSKWVPPAREECCDCAQRSGPWTATPAWTEKRRSRRRSRSSAPPSCSSDSCRSAPSPGRGSWPWTRWWTGSPDWRWMSPTPPPGGGRRGLGAAAEGTAAKRPEAGGPSRCRAENPPSPWCCWAGFVSDNPAPGSGGDRRGSWCAMAVPPGGEACSGTPRKTCAGTPGSWAPGGQGRNNCSRFCIRTPRRETPWRPRRGVPLRLMPNLPLPCHLSPFTFSGEHKGSWRTDADDGARLSSSPPPLLPVHWNAIIPADSAGVCPCVCVFLTVPEASSAKRCRSVRTIGIPVKYYKRSHLALGFVGIDDVMVVTPMRGLRESEHPTTQRERERERERERGGGEGWS